MIALSNGRGRRARRIGTALTLLVGAAIGTAALSPATAQQFRTLGTVVRDIITVCNSTATCIGGKNVSTGPGVLGSSAKGNGVDSGTKNPSATTKVGRAGVYGHDDAMDKGTFNAGVAGFSTYGYGMQATSNLGIGLQANSSNGTALQALAAYGNGILAKSVTAHGVQASSDNSDAIVATTLNPSKTAGIGRSGVYGSDGSTDSGTLNIGVAGISPNGYGVFAQSNAGTGMRAESVSGYGVQATSYSAAGLQTVSTRDNGVDASTQNPSASTLFGRSGVFGHDDSSDNGSLNVGVAGYSKDGDGMQAVSQYGDGILAQSNGYGNGVSAQSFSGNAIDATVGSQTSNSVIAAHAADTNVNHVSIQAFDGNGRAIFTVGNDGSVYITGYLFTAGSCSTGCLSNRRVRSYAPRESEPTMEDVGEGRLIAGEGHVRLDPAFANVIDSHKPYVVFVSPEGPSHALYVKDKSLAGFTVAENDAGHSTIPFGYRIVAKPYGATAGRLPMIEERRQRRPHPRPLAIPINRRGSGHSPRAH